MAANRDYYSDTDLLVYEFETENTLDNFVKNKNMFDFINYLATPKC